MARTTRSKSRTRTVRPTRIAFRPRVEQIEDRTLPGNTLSAVLVTPFDLNLGSEPPLADDLSQYPVSPPSEQPRIVDPFVDPYLFGDGGQGNYYLAATNDDESPLYQEGLRELAMRAVDAASQGKPFESVVPPELSDAIMAIVASNAFTYQPGNGASLPPVEKPGGNAPSGAGETMASPKAPPRLDIDVYGADGQSEAVLEGMAAAGSGGFARLSSFGGPSITAAPNTPRFTLPPADGAIIAFTNVQLETSPFVDPDGDEHLSTDGSSSWSTLTARPANGSGRSSAPSARNGSIPTWAMERSKVHTPVSGRHFPTRSTAPGRGTATAPAK